MAIANNARNVLVTGGTGFIGRNLVQALSLKGYQVTCLVRKKSHTEGLGNDAVRLVVGDLNDPSSIREAGRAIHTVYHLAGSIKAADRKRYFEANQLGTRHLLETLAEVNPGLSRFIHVSSLAAAGPSPCGRGLTEIQEPHPISWYGESKLEAEREVLKFIGTFPVTILRPSAVYGPGDRETLLVHRMIRRGCLFTPGRTARRFSLIHVDDLAAAFIGAAERDTASGEIFYISRPEVYTWEEVGRAIARAMGKRYRPVSLPRWLAVGAGLAGDCWASMTGLPATINTQKIRELLEPSWICDSSKAYRILGFVPVIDLERGIRQTVRWYQDQGWL